MRERVELLGTIQVNNQRYSDIDNLWMNGMCLQLADFDWSCKRAYFLYWVKVTSLRIHEAHPLSLWKRLVA